MILRVYQRKKDTIKKWSQYLNYALKKKAIKFLEIKPLIKIRTLMNEFNRRLYTTEKKL